MDNPRYQILVETHTNAVFGTIRHVITQLADESVEIAARAVALAAPLPNAINMYQVAVKDLEWSSFSAFAFALTLEIVVFLLVEIALAMWDGYLSEPKRYGVPFIVAVSVVAVSVVVVMVIVYRLEAHKIMALLPIVSVCSFVGIGLKRWNERGESNIDAQTSAELLRTELDTVRTESNEYRTESDRLRTELDTVRQELKRVRTESDVSTILSELSEANRRDLLEVVRLVGQHRVTGPADLLSVSDMSRGKIYNTWPTAVVSRMICKNGDGAYHVVEGGA